VGWTAALRRNPDRGESSRNVAGQERAVAGERVEQTD
jgi:hypothetical protein